MTVNLRGTALSNNGQTSSSNAWPVTIPASVQAGDVGIFIGVQHGTGQTFTGASGWTTLSGPDTCGTSMQAQIWVKDLVAADANSAISFSSSTSSRNDGLMVVFYGAAPSSSVTKALATPNSTAVSNHTTPTISTTDDGTMVVSVWVFDETTSGTAATVSAPSGYILDATVTTNYAASASGDYTVQAMHLSQAAPPHGTYGGDTATSSVAALDLLYSLALPPLAAAEPWLINRARLRRATTF